MPSATKTDLETFGLFIHGQSVGPGLSWRTVAPDRVSAY